MNHNSYPINCPKCHCYMYECKIYNKELGIYEKWFKCGSCGYCVKDNREPNIGHSL